MYRNEAIPSHPNLPVRLDVGMRNGFALPSVERNDTCLDQVLSEQI